MNPDNLENVDPSYIELKNALEQNEDEEKKQMARKLLQIIEDGYDKEITDRQKQIEQIEQQICKARKLLHVLRYVLVMSYYDKKELQIEENENVMNFDKQSNIHPAIKRILHKNSFDHIPRRNKRKTRNSTQTAEEPAKETKKIRTETPDFTLNLPQIRPETSGENRKNRTKTKHRIVIGNISKWVSAIPEDQFTHKWMVYVRGPKDTPDVSHIITKVVFYLHPSYVPYDVVEVDKSPFHLSGRGWGEFPIRVQIFFKVSLNKPVDIIHNIKLDDKCTGRQTLGNETLVDLFLYDANEEIPENTLNIIKKELMMNENNFDDEMDIKKELLDINFLSNKMEHDYCGENVINPYNFEHNYSLPYNSDNQMIKPSPSLINPEMQNNQLIYGLGDYLNECMNGFENTTNTITVPKGRFGSVGEILPFLFKRLPLITNGKCLYPFQCKNYRDFERWNIGKKRNAEFNRAKFIKKLLITENIYNSKNWNTKSILMYGRSHLYTIYTKNYGLFRSDSREKSLLLNCFTSSNCDKSTKIVSNDDIDVTVNIDSEMAGQSEPIRNGKKIDISDENLMHHCTFIRQTALDCNVILKKEEIDEGIFMNGSERLILESIKCLAENLIRRAANYAICHNKTIDGNVIIRKIDVEKVMNERKEITQIFQFTNQRKFIEFFS